jgi:hypothetical protein
MSGKIVCWMSANWKGSTFAHHYQTVKPHKCNFFEVIVPIMLILMQLLCNKYPDALNAQTSKKNKNEIKNALQTNKKYN